MGTHTQGCLEVGISQDATECDIFGTSICLMLHGIEIAEWSVGGQEPFVRDCASFLVVRCPQLVGKDDQTTQSKSHQLPAETISTVLACLQACCAYVFTITHHAI